MGARCGSCCRSAVPTRSYMLTLERTDRRGFSEVFSLPRMGLTGLEGSFRLTALVPGTYRVELLERFLDADPLTRMDGRFNPVSLHREEVTIRRGGEALY